MVRCKDGSLYTGITVDIEKRVAVHNSGKGAKYTRSKLPVVLVWSELVEDESAARKKEAGIKRMMKSEKEGMLLPV